MAPSMNGRISIDGRNFHNILAYISLTTIGTYYSWAATIGGISVNEKDCSHLTYYDGSSFRSLYRRLLSRCCLLYDLWG